MTVTGDWDIKWSFSQPHFHLIGTDIELHFGYYPQSKRGHSSHRYILKQDAPLFHSLNIWFKTLWNNGLDAKKEINWIDKKISMDRAVF